jgi:hypothetical protein
METDEEEDATEMCNKQSEMGIGDLEECKQMKKKKKKIMPQKCVISNLKWVLGDLEECKQMKKKKKKKKKDNATEMCNKQI